MDQIPPPDLETTQSQPAQIPSNPATDQSSSNNPPPDNTKPASATSANIGEANEDTPIPFDLFKAPKIDSIKPGPETKPIPDETKIPETKPEPDATKSQQQQQTEQKPDPNIPITAIPLPGQAKFPPGQRDYTGFNEQEIALLKKTPNETFEFVKPRILENKQLRSKLQETEAKVKDVETKLQSSGKLPDSYWEHEQAYTLDPEYQKAANLYSISSDAISFWRQQLKNIEHGQDWQDVAGQSREGNIIFATKTADTESKLIVADRLAEAMASQKDSVNQLQDITQGFKQKVTKTLEIFNNLEDQFFPQYKDKAVLEANPHYQTITKVLKDRKVDRVPLSMFQKLYTHAAALSEYIQEQAANNNKQQTINNLTSKAGPTSGEINTGSTGKVYADPDDEPVKIDDFEAYKKARGG